MKSIGELVNLVNHYVRTEKLKLDTNDMSVCSTDGTLLMYYNVDMTVIWIYQKEAKYRFIFSKDHVHHEYFTVTYPAYNSDDIVICDTTWDGTEEELFQRSLVEKYCATYEDMNTMKELYYEIQHVIDLYMKVELWKHYLN